MYSLLPGQSDLLVALKVAVTVAAAASVVVEHLLRCGLSLPSLYLQRGGRLRCQAVRGYWQVFDGIPFGAGVIGTTFRTGQPREIRGVASSADYLAATLAVVDEVCVPIMTAGKVVGVLNVESTGGLPADAMALTTAAATAFAHRLVELGGVPAESPAQTLARHAVIIADTKDDQQLWAAGCEAAREITGYGSAVVVLNAPGQQHRVTSGVGPIAERLSLAPSTVLADVAAWVASGSSCWTMNDPAGRGFAGSDTLREAGAGAVMVVPLARTNAAGGDGFLLVTDPHPAALATDTVELLEMLGIHLTGCARSMTALIALRRQASRDPLTDLGHHAAFQEALAAALDEVFAVRQVAVIMLDIDHFKSINDQRGHPAGDEVLRTAARVLSKVLRDGEELYRIGGDEFATILHVATPSEAVAVAVRLRDAARAHLGATLSIGVAVAAADITPAALVTAADNALYKSKRAGRNRVHAA